MEYTAGIVAFALIYAICAIADNTSIGYSGQFAIAQGAFFGVGAYTYGIGSQHDLATPLLILLAVSIAFVAGSALAFVGRALRGDYFMIITLAFQIIAVQVASNLAVTGGSGGLFGLRPLSVFGYSPSVYTQWVLVLAPITFLVWLFYTLVLSTRLGLILKAVREDDAAAMSLGRSVVLYKMIALGLGAAGTSFAGALYASNITFIDPNQFSFTFSVFIVSILIVGGMANPLGPIVGAVVLTGLPEALRLLPSLPDDTRARLLQVIYGLALLLIVAFRPQGLVPERPGRWSLASWRWRLNVSRKNDAVAGLGAEAAP
jgi:ABC-type branched-subunit amino acid transport system permease subunit